MSPDIGKGTEMTVAKINVYVKGAGWYPAVRYMDGTDHVVEFVDFPGIIGVDEQYNTALNLAAHFGEEYIKLAKEKGWTIPEGR